MSSAPLWPDMDRTEPYVFSYAGFISKQVRERGRLVICPLITYHMVGG